MESKFTIIISVTFIFTIFFVGTSHANEYSQAMIDNTVAIGTDGTDLALDSQGHQGICYQDITHGVLKYASFDGNDWTIETADAANGSGSYCAIVFDNNDWPNIVYYNSATSELRHARKPADVWEVNVIEDGITTDFMTFGANRISIAKDSAGWIGIAYYDSTPDDLIFADFDGVAWVVEEVVTNGDVGRFPSLDFDSHDNPGIAYQEFTNNDVASLKYIYHDGNDWQLPETVDDSEFAGSFNSLQFDKNDVPHIAYRSVDDGNTEYLKYTSKVSGDWGIRTLATGSAATASVGQYCEMVLGNEGNAHIIYRDYFFSALFGSSYRLKLFNLYFVDNTIPSQVMARDDTLAFSVAPKRHYAGMALALDDQDNLAYSLAMENADNDDYSLYAGELTAWTSAVKLLKPDAVDHESVNDAFELTWLDFDPDSNAEIKFYYRDADWNYHEVGETVNEDEANSYVLDTSNIPGGSYVLNARISDDGFVMYQSSNSPEELTVPDHEQADPQAQAVPVVLVNPDNQNVGDPAVVDPDPQDADADNDPADNSDDADSIDDDADSGDGVVAGADAGDADASHAGDEGNTNKGLDSGSGLEKVSVSDVMAGCSLVSYNDNQSLMDGTKYLQAQAALCFFAMISLSVLRARQPHTHRAL